MYIIWQQFIFVLNLAMLVLWELEKEKYMLMEKEKYM